MSEFVVRAFVKLRQSVIQHVRLSKRLAKLERRLGPHDQQIVDLVETERHLMSGEAVPPKCGSVSRLASA